MLGLGFGVEGLGFGNSKFWFEGLTAGGLKFNVRPNAEVKTHVQALSIGRGSTLNILPAERAEMALTKI